MPVTLQSSLALPVRALTWLGGQGTRAIAALVFFGIAVPPLGELLKPFVTEAVFLLLCISFMRVDIAALRDHLRRPGIVLAATAWTTLGVPLIIGVSGRAAGLDAHSPDLFLALMLQAVASPMMASPALAAVMGLGFHPGARHARDQHRAGSVLGADVRLRVFRRGADAFAAWARAEAGRYPRGIAVGCGRDPLDGGASAIKRHAAPIDGLNILILFVFVAAVMGSVAGSFLADPVGTVELALLAFAVFFALLGVTVLIFRRIGHDRALALGLMVSQRNMGLMLAATDGVLPGPTWLYFALCQFPIYLSPQLLKPIVSRLSAQEVAPAVTKALN